MPFLGIGLSFPLLGVAQGSVGDSLLSGELSGFSLDFILNSSSVRTVTNEELLFLQLGDEWNGMAIDFTTDLVTTRISTGAEALLGSGPDTQEFYGLGLDFTDNTFALRN